MKKKSVTTIIQKLLMVVASCKTTEQEIVAGRYISLAMKRYNWEAFHAFYEAAKIYCVMDSPELLYTFFKNDFYSELNRNN